MSSYHHPCHCVIKIFVVSSYIIFLFSICFNLKTHKLEKGFNTDDAVALSEALKKNNTVEQLCLMSSDIGNVGGVAIASALRQNTTLKYLE